MKIRPARQEDVGAICEMLHTKMNRKFSLERWRRLFTYAWLADKPDLGRVVDDNGRIVGFLAALYADREIDGRTERVISTSSWYLDKSARGLGLGAEIMRDLASNDGTSTTQLTLSKLAVPVTESLDFKILDDRRYEWRRHGAPKTQIEVLDNPEDIAPLITAAERRMIADHRPYAVTPMHFRAGGTHCLAFFSIKRKYADITYFDLLHTSDTPFLAQHAQALADTILPEPQAVLAIESRFLHGQPVAPGAQEVRLPVAHYFRSSRLEPHQIDLLYSELQVLDQKLD